MKGDFLNHEILGNYYMGIFYVMQLYLKFRQLFHATAVGNNTLLVLNVGT
jgi:hypothetical protein